MWMVSLGILSFLLFYCHDFLQVRYPGKAHSGYFFVGLALLVVSTGGVIALSIGRYGRPMAVTIPALCAAGVFLLLLVHTLFFAIPYDATYQNQTGKRALVSAGVYALCRHPGILWFAAFYLFLWLAFGGSLLLLSLLLFSSLNYLYAYLQDRWVFPQQFDGYERYQKETPFLIPTAKSIHACISTLGVRTR